MRFTEEMRQNSTTKTEKQQPKTSNVFSINSLPGNVKRAAELDIAYTVEECHMIQNHEVRKVERRVSFRINKRKGKFLIKGLTKKRASQCLSQKLKGIK